MEEKDPEEEIHRTQALKAGVHFTVGKICEEVGTQEDLTFSKQVIATLSEVVYKTMGTYTKDLEAFASHGRRTSICPEDIKLLVRRNSQLGEHVKAMADDLEAQKKAVKKKRKSAEPGTSDQL